MTNGIPTYTCQIGFGVGTKVAVVGRAIVGKSIVGGPVGTSADGVTWTTVTGLRSVSCHRGRSSPLQPMEAGRAAFVFENQDGRFSPENVSGSYYPNVKALRRIRLYATFGALDFPLFYGFIENWQTDVDSDGQDIVRISATDAFLLFANTDMPTALWDAEYTHSRALRLLNGIQWPTNTLSYLPAAQNDCASFTPSAGYKVLAHLQDIYDAEQGRCWVGPNGKVQGRGRYSRLTYARSKKVVSSYPASYMSFSENTAADGSQAPAVFGGYSGLPYRMAPGFGYGDQLLYNDVRITRTGGTEQTAEDSDSQEDYGDWTLRKSSSHIYDDANAKSIAQWILAEQAQPQTRLSTIELEGGGNDDLWPVMLGLEIDDRICVKRTFPGALGLNGDFWIEGVEHVIEFGNGFKHLTRLRTVKADPVTWAIVGGSKGMCAHFTAANSEYLTINDNAALSMGSGVKPTMIVWARADSLPGVDPPLLFKRLTNTTFEYTLKYSTGSAAFRFDVSPDGTAANAVSLLASTYGALALATWVMVAVQYTGSKLRISVNGGAWNEQTYSSDISDSTSPFRIGGDTQSSRFWDGRIQCVGIWKSALNDMQLAELYNGGSPLPYDHVPLGLRSTASIVAYWNLDEWSDGSGAVSRADSAAANTLTDTNTVTASPGAATIRGGTGRIGTARVGSLSAAV